MCTDVAYQLGNSIYGGLRTPIINFFQKWCGNRFGKSLIRVGGSNYPLTDELKDTFSKIAKDFLHLFTLMSDRTFNLPSVLNRFEGIGTVPFESIHKIGAVGMVARMGGLQRDVRCNYPTPIYEKFPLFIQLAEKGDVWARAEQRRLEIIQSFELIHKLMKAHQAAEKTDSPNYKINLEPNSLAISLVEGWRGEICQVLVTNENGEFEMIKIKDPSFHNWHALELALRNLEISDFPINNKSFDLSYCGFDL